MQHKSNKPYLVKPLALAIGMIAITTSLELVAQEPAQRVEELIVTATRLPRPINEVAGTVTLITAKDISREVADDLDDLTRYQPGITMDTSSRGGNQGFIIRGIGGNRVLTVVDGIRSNDIYSAGPSSYGKDSFEIDDFKAVEVIRGPASVLYGADAMGGAVVLRTKDPSDYLVGNRDSYFDIRTSAASADEQYKLGVTGVQDFGDFDVMAQLTHRQFEEADVNGSGRLNPLDGDSNNLLLRSSWQISDRQQLLFTVDAFREELDAVLNTDLSSSVTESYGRDETDRTRFGIEYRWQPQLPLFDEVDLAVQQQETEALQHTEQVRNSFSFIIPGNFATYGGTEARRVTDFEFNQDTLNLGANFRKSIESGDVQHSLVYGLNHEVTDTERPRNRCEEQLSSSMVTCSIAAYPFAPTENFPNKTFPDTETTREGIYLQDEIVFGDSGFTLIPGIRYDRYEMDASIDPLLDGTGDIENYGGYQVTSLDVSDTTFNLGAVYDVNDQVSLFAQYAEGYRPPNFDESNQAFVNLGFGYATVPNPDLDPESSDGIELGIRTSTDNAYLALSYYDNRYDDFIESSYVGNEAGIDLFQDRNIGEARIRGAELTSILYLNDQWQLRGALAYSKGDNEEDDVPLDSVEPLTGVFGVRFDDPNGTWGTEALVTWVDEKDRVSADDRVTADSYAVFDLIGHYNFGESSSIRFGLFNLFDEEYARWANIQGLAASSASTIARAQQPGRNVRVAWNISF